MLIGSTVLSAVMMKYIFQYKEVYDETTGKLIKSESFTWTASLMFGSIISATDPVAVVALLKELGASKRLSTMIEGESLLNDGTAMVVFLVLFDLVVGKQLTAIDVVKTFI